MEPLNQRDPGDIEYVEVQRLPQLVDNDVDNADAGERALKIQSLSKYLEPNRLGNSGQFAGFVQHVAGMKFLAKLPAVRVAKAPTEIEDGFQRIVPPEFMHDKPAEREVPARTAVDADVATLIHVEQVHDAFPAQVCRGLRSNDFV